MSGRSRVCLLDEIGLVFYFFRFANGFRDGMPDSSPSGFGHMVTNMNTINAISSNAVFSSAVFSSARSWNADSAKAGSARLLRFCRVVLLTLLFTNVMTAARADTNSDAGRDIGGDAEVVRITVLGDSLVAGYGLPPGTSFPDALDSALVAAGFKVEVVNAGVSGDTTAGGLARLDWSLADDPDMVIIVMGGNDMLRGLDPAATRANLDAMITRLRAQGVTVLLAGMLAPRNLGADYVAEFDSLYPALAARHETGFYPFFLDGVAMDAALNLPDGLHPNKAGIDEITRRILPVVTEMLAGLQG